MRIPDFRKLMLRAFPGLGGYHALQYARVTKVHSKPGIHTKNQPICCVDILFLDSDLTVDRSRKEKPNVEIMRASRHITDLPREGDSCVLSFLDWQANSAVLIGVLYETHEVEPEEGVFKLSGADQVKLSAKNSLSIEETETVGISATNSLTLGSGEDKAVLANVLKTKLETLIDKITDLLTETMLLGQGGVNVSNGTINYSPTFTTNATLINSELVTLTGQLAEIVSNIKIGMDSQ